MSNPKTVVRQATPEDGQAWLALINALAEYESLQPPDEAARERLLNDAFGPQPRFLVYLALVADSIVGYAITLETYSSFLALPSLYLEDIFVLSKYRRQGVGTELFRYCLDEAVRRGCGRMEWMVLDWNKMAQDFYQRMGARRLSEWVPYRIDRKHMMLLQERYQQLGDLGQEML